MGSAAPMIWHLLGQAVSTVEHFPEVAWADGPTVAWCYFGWRCRNILGRRSADTPVT